MPITPFHFGPAALVHAISPKRVSFLSFCAANVLVDIEPLYYLLSGEQFLHRFFHTYIGLTAVILCTVWLFTFALRLKHWRRLPNLFGWKHLTRQPIVLGAILGGYSHIFLDSLMHADIMPFAPFSLDNGLYRFLSVDTLEWICLYSGILGALMVMARKMIRRSKSPLQQ